MMFPLMEESKMIPFQSADSEATQKNNGAGRWIVHEFSLEIRVEIGPSVH